MNQTELNEVIRLHGMWLRGEASGVKANLHGADLRGANMSGANMSGASLIDADLRGANMSGANMSGASLIDADLRGANMSGANMSGANMSGADLSDANLHGADLGDIPVIESIDAAILSAIGEDAAGLNMSHWHCGTTHCRAGWAVTLAGAAGARLEAKIGTANAGALIYAASRPDRCVPNFYASNEETLADLRGAEGA